MRKWGPLAAVGLGTFMLLIDVTICVVALPAMATGLHASLSDLQWVIDAYALALAALLLGFGAAADILGRRLLYVLGVTVFAVASTACGLAPGAGVLVAARVVQGVGAAAMFATTLPLLASVYRGRERSVALGVWGAVSGAAAAVGPVLGGVLTAGPGWRWIFYVNVPVSVAAVWLTLRAVPESRGRDGARVDWAGTVTFAGFAGALTYAAVRAGSAGWTDPGTAAACCAGVLALGAFVRVELRAAHPLLDLSLLRGRAFVGVLAGSFAFSGAAFGVLPYTSIWLQTVLGMSPVRGGLVVLPMSLAAFVVSGAAGRLLHGVAPRLTIGAGLVLVGVGGCLQAVLDAGSGWPALVPGLVVAGAGTGLVAPSIAGAALAAVPAERSGMAGGSVNTFRQLGYALGVAVFGTLVTSRMARTLPAGVAHAVAGGGAAGLRGRVPEHTVRAAFAAGLDTAALAAGSAGVAAGVLVLVLVRGGTAAEAGPRAADAPRPAARRS